MTKPVELRDLDPQNAYIRSPRATDPAFTSGDSASRELLRHFESEAAAVNTPPSAVTPMQVRPLGTSSQGHDEPEPPSPHTRTRGLPTQLTVRLYTSHFLSTWNSRWFEFGAVLFLASIFPGTLLPMSAYALVRSGAAILLSQPVGAWIDRGDRLEVVRTSIIGQRVAVAFSCGAFWAMETGKDDLGSDAKNGLLGLTVLLACVEKLCAMVNLIAVERDWVSDCEIERRICCDLTHIRLLSLPMGMSTLVEVSLLHRDHQQALTASPQSSALGCVGLISFASSWVPSPSLPFPRIPYKWQSR